MNYIQQIQDLLTKRFQNLLHSQWMEKIVQKVESVIELLFKDKDEH